MDILEYITPCKRSDASRAEAIARTIEGLIIDRCAEPGMRLGTKENLRQRFEVSPGTMNEAIRLLVARGILVTRRGLKGGVFVMVVPAQIPFSEILFGLKYNAAMIEQCQAVSKQLAPLVFVEATKAANASAVAELQRLVQNMAAAVDQPAESLRWSWLFYRRSAEMGFNTVLTALYTTILKFLEQEISQAVVPVVNYVDPQQVVAKSGELIGPIASGDIQLAATFPKRNHLQLVPRRKGVFQIE
jgi:DNA-binding FadR family transcriptional regulator